MERVQAPVIPWVGELIRRHPGTVTLGQGVVSYGPPAAALAAATVADHRYHAVDGFRDLREALAEKLAAENGVRGSTVVVTAGGNMGFLNAVLAVTDPGDEVILPAPYYFNHEMAVGIAGAVAVFVPTDARHHPRPDAVAAAVTPRTRAVVTVSPNNPTGAVYPEETLRAINALCKARGLCHISDEAYEYFTWDGARHFSPGSIEGAAEHTISLYSFSKAYGMAAWRVGYMALPGHLHEAVMKIQDTNLICPTAVSERAALAALREGRAYCDRLARPLAEVRRSVLEGLGAVCRVPPADGAFYFYPTFDLPLTPEALVERLVAEHGVALVPGTTFGSREGCTVRLSYGALEPAAVAEGMRRLLRGIKAMA